MKNRVRTILTNLESVREDLLALSDDIWLSIDHNDSEALDEGVKFKKDYNARLTEFEKLSDGISTLIQHFTETELEPADTPAEEHSSSGDAEQERIIKELDVQAPHTLDEDWCYIRPHGYVLDGRAYKDLVTWRRLYELVCLQLAGRDSTIFARLPEQEEFISNRGNQAFSRDPDQLRHAMNLSDGIYAEANLSANSIRKNIKALLAEFGVDESEFRVYFREDRDAEGSHE